MKPAESYNNQESGHTKASQKMNMLLQNIIEEINESKSFTQITPTNMGGENKSSQMSIQIKVAEDEANRDSYTQLGPKLEYKQQIKSLNKSSSTRIGLKYLARNDEANLNENSSIEGSNEQPVMRS